MVAGTIDPTSADAVGTLTPLPPCKPKPKKPTSAKPLPASGDPAVAAVASAISEKGEIDPAKFAESV
eukprot:8938452-Pyramimonas_sp.AAC.1